MSDDWEGWPLRKDYEAQESFHGIVVPKIKEEEGWGSKGDQMVLNIGPQHPSTHGVLRLEVTTDGEIVSKITPI